MKKKEPKESMIVTIYLPRVWNDRISSYAVAKDRSRNEVYRDAIKFFIDIKDS